MALDDEMPLAVEALADTVGFRDTMGICCFGEQGMNNLRQPMHGNLMCGTLLFSSVARHYTVYGEGLVNDPRESAQLTLESPNSAMNTRRLHSGTGGHVEVQWVESVLGAPAGPPAWARPRARSGDGEVGERRLGL